VRPAGYEPPRSVPAVGADPARLARQLATAEGLLGQPVAGAATLVRQALILQVICLKLAANPSWVAPVLAATPRSLRATATADIAATADLVAITPPQPRLPPWQLIPAASLAALRRYYRLAQTATGINWSYLAAINFVETDFGRIRGPSSAGAQGPMQFMPATWTQYGRGDIYQPRAAIMAAARLLAADGGAHAIGPALYAYNHSPNYVDAVLRFAARLRAEPGALLSYYRHQILYRLRGGWVWLPPGYGSTHGIRAVPVHV